MLSEYDVRQAVVGIEQSDLLPMAKARQLLGIARQLRRQQRSLKRGNQILEQDLDFDAASRLNRLQRQQERLIEDVRLAAFHTLKSAPLRLGFETVPPPPDLASI